MKVRFGSYVLDSGARELSKLSDNEPRASSAQPVHLSPKAFDILEILVARRPNVVSKDVLMREVWGSKVVEEANLAIVIGEIRKALGDDSRSPAIVLTVPRRGYRFAASAEEVGADGRTADQFVRCWLTWNDKTLPLREGENVIGRHPACTVWINASSVSRTHARIITTQGTATIVDEGSRNGTFVDGQRIAGAHPLADGATITFGSERATFRQWSDEQAAGTEPVSPR
jgi:DNA-binding winged helix-turn-helix (wHTH) protein